MENLRSFKNGDKPHGCELCKKKFALACNLRAHMKTHDGDLQDECVRCEKPIIGNSIILQRNKICEKCLDLGDSENEKKFALPAKQSMDTEEEADSSIGATESSEK
ncbi:zinc finger protein 26 isoform X2 [Drosophila virilis]|uniref:zinc finger protein 26 isoform X2 n=1 Tax=Drosophila virilis TaxID=7244 RepID=UPI0038B3C32B